MLCPNCKNKISDGVKICPQCGCAVTAVNEKASVVYRHAVENAFITDIIGVSIMLLGAVLGFLLNAYLGAVLLLAAEIITMIPNSKLQKAFKNNGLTKSDKDKMKEIMKNLKAECPGYKISKILAPVALILLISVLMVPYFLI